MDRYRRPGYPHSQNGELSSTAPSSRRDSLLRQPGPPSSTDFTDISHSDSYSESEKPLEQTGHSYNLAIRGNDFPPATGSNDPLTRDLSLRQGTSQSDNGRLLPSYDGAIHTTDRYRRAVHDKDLLPGPGDASRSIQAPHLISTPPGLQPYNEVPTEHSPIGGAHQWPTPFNSTDIPSRSTSGKRRKRSDGGSQILEDTQPTWEKILVLWQQSNPGCVPNEAERLALSVVTKAPESIIQYFLSKHYPRAIDLPLQQFTTPAQPRPARRIVSCITCTVKRRISQPWNRPRDPEKPYSCLGRCGWTFTKKGDWIKHERINHPEEYFVCPAPDCKSVFYRKDKLRDHIRKVHELHPEDFNLDSRRIPIGNPCNDRCGFCGHYCMSWSEWYDHVGEHFEGRIDGGPSGPWTMARWRYPWADDDAGEGYESGDDGNDPGNDGKDSDDQDAPNEPDDEFEGSGGQAPSHGLDPQAPWGTSRSGGRGGGHSGAQHQGGRNYYTRSSQPPAPSTGMRQISSSPRTNSMPQPKQHRPKTRQQKIKSEVQRGILHPHTWPLNKDQSPPSPMTTDRTNPLVDLAVTGKSQRDARNAELAPYLEKKAQVLAPTSQAKDTFGGLLPDASNPLPTPSFLISSTHEIVEPGDRTLPNVAARASSLLGKWRYRRESHNLFERGRCDNINENIHGLSRLVPQHQLESDVFEDFPSNKNDLSPTNRALNTEGFELPSTRNDILPNDQTLQKDVFELRSGIVRRDHNLTPHSDSAAITERFEQLFRTRRPNELEQSPSARASRGLPIKSAKPYNHPITPQAKIFKPTLSGSVGSPGTDFGFVHGLGGISRKAWRAHTDEEVKEISKRRQLTTQERQNVNWLRTMEKCYLCRQKKRKCAQNSQIHRITADGIATGRTTDCGEKGLSSGDIFNDPASWTHDLTWNLQPKLEQESVLGAPISESLPLLDRPVPESLHVQPTLGNYNRDYASLRGGTDNDRQPNPRPPPFLLDRTGNEQLRNYKRLAELKREHFSYNSSSPNSSTPESEAIVDESMSGRCPVPECGRMFKDLKAHMLNHQSVRPEKCPVLKCEYSHNGFVRKYDKNRHILTHFKSTTGSEFPPRFDLAAEKSFNRADASKWHLTSVHGTKSHIPSLSNHPKPYGSFPSISVGDIVATTQLAWKMRKAFSVVQHAPKVFQDIKDQVENLTTLLAAIGQLILQADHGIHESAEKVLEQCGRTLSSVYLLVNGYQENKMSYQERYGKLEFRNLWQKTVTDVNLEALSSKLESHVQSVSLIVLILRANNAIIKAPHSSYLTNFHNQMDWRFDVILSTSGALELWHERPRCSYFWKQILGSAEAVSQITVYDARGTTGNMETYDSHLDLKPANIQITFGSSKLCIADFRVSTIRRVSNDTPITTFDAELDNVKSKIQMPNQLLVLARKVVIFGGLGIVLEAKDTKERTVGSGSLPSSEASIVVSVFSESVCFRIVRQHVSFLLNGPEWG